MKVMDAKQRPFRGNTWQIHFKRSFQVVERFRSKDTPAPPTDDLLRLGGASVTGTDERYRLSDARNGIVEEYCKVPVLLPLLLGTNPTVTVQLAPPERKLPQVDEDTKKSKSVPLAVIDEIANDADPVLLNVTIPLARSPTCTGPKSRIFGVTTALGGGGTINKLIVVEIIREPDVPVISTG